MDMSPGQHWVSQIGTEIGSLPSNAVHASQYADQLPAPGGAGPSAFRPFYNESGNDNYVEIERKIKSLLVDPDYCLFDMSTMQLITSLSSHGVNTATITSHAKAVLCILDHIMNGKCFLDSSKGVACNIVKRGIRDLRSMSVLAAESILTHVDDTERLRSVCLSLGYTESDLARCSSGYIMKRLIEMSRDQFSTCFDIPEIISQFDSLSVNELKVISRAHDVNISDLENLPVLDWIDLVMTRLINHFSAGLCDVGSTTDDRRVVPKCRKSLGNEVLLQLTVLDAVIRGHGTVRPMRLLLRSLNIEYDPRDSVKHLKARLRAYVKFVRRSKHREVGRAQRTQSRRAEREEVHEQHTANLNSVRSEWPQTIPENVRRMLAGSFQAATSSDSMRTRVCAVCAEEKYRSELLESPVPISDGRLHLYLLRGSYPIGVSDPFAGNESLRGLMLDPRGVVDDADGGNALWTCGSCYRVLSRKFVPRLAIANYMFVGDVPDCLKDLTVVEEAMIARRRAKCWIIHLNAEGVQDHAVHGAASHGTRNQASQRGIRGHIVVYPSEPQNLGSVLPPSMEDVITPMCVVFIGSSRPSEQWLRANAKPLLIRREKVRNALLWLKQNNPLYADVDIDHPTLDSLPDEGIAPVEISVEAPTEATNAIGARYDYSGEEGFENESNTERTDFGFEKAVVADLDLTNLKSSEMAAAALQHLRDGGSFLQIPHGQHLCNEYDDFDLFPLLYPTLFPYGLGGFEHPLRKRSVGMKVHARHLFSIADKRFQEHYSFLFTVFNVLQRRIVNEKARLKVKKSYFSEFATSLQNLTDGALSRVADRVSKGDYTTAYSDEEKLVLRLMKEVNLVSQPVPGSSASKQATRNQIRAMMTDLGLPSFYITINPADIHNPLVRFMAGEQIDVDDVVNDQQSNSRDQSFLIAKNPFLAAKFFNVYMEAFFKCLLGFDKKTMSCDNGVLGVTKGYFGCVEAQGRGSLHCHLLVWLEGALDPQEIKDRVVGAGDHEFGVRLCEFIDDIVKNGLAHDENSTDERQPHPCRVRGPLVPSGECSVERESWYRATRDRDIAALVKHCQRHRHTHTCYKYWKGGDERKECRFNLDESHHVDRTTIHPVSGEMNFAVQDGMVNNFCETILQAMRCNMDIKFIGSGASAKAILFYITDYITKSQLSAHVAYQTLQAAVQKLERRNDVSDDSFSFKAKRMLVKCANALISQQELSAPQVASYLMDFGDHYTSHKFRNLFWRSFESHVQAETDALAAPTDNEEHSEPNEDSEPNFITEDDDNENFVLVERDVDGHIFQKGSQLLDYRLRGDLFDDLSVWDYVAYVDKVKIDKKKKKKSSNSRSQRTDIEEAQEEERMSENGDVDEVDDSVEDDPEADEILRDDRSFTWHCSNPRSMFQSSHPESKTHFARRRRDLNRLVPVMIGPRVYRRDVPELRENYCRLMLILFKPWRTAEDLKSNLTTWDDAFHSFCLVASPYVKKVMENMQRMHECKDSRDEHYANRRNRIRGSNSIAEEFVSSSTNEDESYTDLGDALPSDDDPLAHISAVQDSRSRYLENERINADAAVQAGVHAGLYNETPISELQLDADSLSEDSLRIQLLHEPEKLWKKAYAARRKEAKKTLMSGDDLQRDPVNTYGPGTSDIEIGQIRSVEVVDERRGTVNASIDVGAIPVQQHIVDGHVLIEQVCTEFTLNEEQACAFKRIADHSLLPRTPDLEPVQMFLGGPGGTGKSRVLDALRSFFERRNQSRRLRVVSYTGSAACNVGGVTIHSALLMSQPDSARKKNDLTAMWKGVDYLFIDEISMVGCLFLSKISHNLMTAKQSDASFGGISVVFAGDFCQLPPIQDTALYSSMTHMAGYTSTSLTKEGQGALSGRLSWLDLSCSILLHQQMRQAGRENNVFRDLLNRIRVGKGTHADFELLKTRVLQNLPHEQRAKLSSEWSLVPIITSSNATKDALNEKAVHKFANDRGLPVHYYYARDFAKKTPVALDVQNALYSLHSGETNQLMGKLPLVIGMPVILTHNYDVPGGVVNGSEGILKAVRFTTDDSGRRYATSCVVTVPSCTGARLDFLQDKEVVAFSESASFALKHRQRGDRASYSRHQLPICPAFAYTDYKAQGRTMDRVIVDLDSCKNLQSAYVMLSRAKSLDGLLILREFDSKHVLNPLNGDLRVELKRLTALASHSDRMSQQQPLREGHPPHPGRVRRRNSSNASPGPSSRRRRLA